MLVGHERRRQHELQRRVQIEHERRAARRSISAASAALSGSESGAVPVDELFVRLAGTRSAGSIPAG